MLRSRLWWFLTVVLLALIGGALVAVLVLRPWETGSSPDQQRFPRAAVAGNGYECAHVGRISKLPLWSVCMVGSQVDISGSPMWRVGFTLAMVLGLAANTGTLAAADCHHPLEFKRYPRGAVASNGYKCASVGRSILEKNGSAVDAAIATLFCEGISCAQCMGLGGGFLATIYDAGTGRVRVLNARERAPAATTNDMFANASSTVGALATAIPGELRGYGEMYREYGRLPWRDLVLPTAALCRNGYRVNIYMARALQMYKDVIKAEPSLREVYVNNATGEVLLEGDLIREPVLAATLEQIAEEGPEAIHDGSLTSRFVQDIQAHGGIITGEDLRNYRVEWQEPITAQIDEEHTLYVNPLPGSGSVLAFIMNMLRGWVGGGPAPLGSDLYWHRIVETFKYAYAKRTRLGDPSRSNPLPYDIRELERNLSDPQWAESHRELVNDSRTYNDWQHYGAMYEGADDHGTAHALVVAPDGSVVSVTSTVNFIWGSQRRSRSLGIILNNQMDDFAIPNRYSVYGLPPSPANLLAPGLQPLSSMVPSIVLNREGEAILVAGGAGGTKITTQVSLLLRHNVIEGQALVKVISRPRLHHQLLPMEIQYEEDFNEETMSALSKKGHVINPVQAGAGFAAIVAAERDRQGPGFWCLLDVVLLSLVGGALVAVLVLRPWEDTGSCHQRFPRAAVAGNGYECAGIGRRILQKNGSAVDAAIATLFCEGVSCAQCMGLGGGFLATIYDAGTGRVRVLNARERAPTATTYDMFANASSTVGALAMAIPGELRGYGAMYREYGRLPWRELVMPTALLCRDGYRVNTYMARALRMYSDIIKAEPSLREIYVNEETGDVWHEGNMIVEPALAVTLEQIAEEGPEAIHDGSLTSRFVQDIQAHGGIITAEDLRNYRVEWQEPITAQIDEEHTLYVNPLPGSGSVLAFIMNMLRGWVGGGPAPLGSDLYWHRIVETFKYAYAKRTGLGDPSRSNVPYDIRELERNLSDPRWAESYRDLVNDSRTYNDWQHYGAMYEGADDHGTAHALVVAPDGSVVSVTSTVNFIWGCQRRSQSLGIILNNEMDDFSVPNTYSVYGLPPSPANFLAPGLQPLSSMVPSIVLNREGEAILVVGGAGGTKITTQISLIIRHNVIEGQGLVNTINRPRLHHQLLPMEIQYEDEFDEVIIRALKKKEHVIKSIHARAGFAAIVGAERDRHGYLIPQADCRRPGSVDGF